MPASAGGHAQRAGRLNAGKLALCAAVLLAGGIAAVVILLLHPFRSSHAPAANGEPLSISATKSPGQSTPAQSTPAQSGSAQSGSAQPAEQQAAQRLATLLSQSVADRSSIVRAVNDVNGCTGNLSQDEQTFTSAADSRNTLLAQLASLPDSSALPQPMLQALQKGWQASAQADQDFAQWARDENSRGCTPSDHSDPGYAAANGPDALATTEKHSFASRWDPIAVQYGLTAYQWYQL